VVVRNCIARKGAGLITCGSETSGSIRNILAYNMKAYGTSSALRIKSAMNRGGTVENIYMDNVKADSVGSVLAADLNWNPSYSYSTLPEKYVGKEIPEHWKVMLTPVVPVEKGYPHFKNVYLSNVKAQNAKQFISASGWNNKLRLENFYLNNIKANVEGAGNISFTDHFSIKNIKLKVSDKSKVVLKENTNLKIKICYE
jgi:polygalacturonase